MRLTDCGVMENKTFLEQLNDPESYIYVEVVGELDSEEGETKRKEEGKEEEERR